MVLQNILGRRMVDYKFWRSFMGIVPSLLQGALESFGIAEAKCSLVFPLGSHDPKIGLNFSVKLS